MKTAFIATSYKHRDAMADVLDCIKDALLQHGYDPCIFVRQYSFAPDDTKNMMQTSFHHIHQCDLFIAELTHKVVGVGIETGYASGCNKPIVYLRQQATPLSTTMTGIADYSVVYQQQNDLATQLDSILRQLDKG